MSLFVLLDFNMSDTEVVIILAVLLTTIIQLVTATFFTVNDLVKKEFGFELLIYWILFAINMGIWFAGEDDHFFFGENLRYASFFPAFIYFFVYLGFRIARKRTNKST